MKKELWFLGFLNENGRPLSVDYQSEEKALSVEYALQAIELLSEEKRASICGKIKVLKLNKITQRSPL